jgi:hypothetical protein
MWTRANFPLVPILLAVALLAGCGGVTLKELLGYPADPTPTLSGRTAAQPWVLIKNPAFGSRPSEPEFIWVEEDKIPTTMGTMVFGKQSIVASPEIVARYGAPPGGGRVSSLHGGPYSASSQVVPAKAPARVEPKPAPAPPPAVLPPTRGYVVYVDTTRVVIDLTAQDGLKLGSVVSLRRAKIPIVHPVTGELLGELEEEVATARVIEVRERFSVTEIQGLAPGAQVKVKDRVFLQ